MTPPPALRPVPLKPWAPAVPTPAAPPRRPSALRALFSPLHWVPRPPYAWRPLTASASRSADVICTLRLQNASRPGPALSRWGAGAEWGRAAGVLEAGRARTPQAGPEEPPPPRSDGGGLSPPAASCPRHSGRPWPPPARARALARTHAQHSSGFPAQHLLLCAAHPSASAGALLCTPLGLRERGATLVGLVQGEAVWG